MPEESQFHMTVVTQKRVPRHEPDKARVGKDEKPTPGEAPAAAVRGEHHGHPERHEHHAHHGQQGSDAHRRHYNDFGTVDLGSLEEPLPTAPFATDDPAAPSQGQLQKEFYDKYDTVLTRRYQTRNRKKTNRILVIVGLLLVILVLSLFGIGALQEQTAETLSKPDVETIPVVTLDLGDRQ